MSYNYMPTKSNITMSFDSFFGWPLHRFFMKDYAYTQLVLGFISKLSKIMWKDGELE